MDNILVEIRGFDKTGTLIYKRIKEVKAYVDIGPLVAMAKIDNTKIDNTDIVRVVMDIAIPYE